MPTHPDIRRARNETHTDPTPSQASAGNYKKGRVTLHGLDIAIENPRGSTRRGYDADGNVEWESAMHADYGYFTGSRAIDGDAVDVFIGDHPESEIVVAIDQQDGDKFDETKFILGTRGRDEAVRLYRRHYPRGWRVGEVTTVTVAQLKLWLKEGDTKAPFAGQFLKAAAADKGCLMAQFVNAAEIPLWTYDQITARHLAEDGIEGEPHVTVCYGFTDPTPQQWREVSQVLDLRNQDFEVELGEVRIFRADDNRPKSDCVVVEVVSDDLTRLNRLCRDHWGIRSRHGRYRAHLTLAYVKPGKANHLEGSKHFAGRRMQLASFLWSALGTKQVIVLGRPWQGYDLDGTLAESMEPFDAARIGPPVPKMIEQLKQHLADGHRCKILTARANDPESIPLIRSWLAGQGIEELEVTAFKDMAMVMLRDDKAQCVLGCENQELTKSRKYDDGGHGNKKSKTREGVSRPHKHAAVSRLERHENALCGPNKSDVSVLRSSGGARLQKMARQLLGIPGGYGRATPREESGSDKPERGLREIELPVGNSCATIHKYAKDNPYDLERARAVSNAVGEGVRVQQNLPKASPDVGMERREGADHAKKSPRGSAWQTYNVARGDNDVVAMGEEVKHAAAVPVAPFTRRALGIDASIYDSGGHRAPSQNQKTPTVKQASDSIQQRLNDSGLPHDLIFYTDGGDRATAMLGDWHGPDDTEIGRPEWATTELSAERTKKADMGWVNSQAEQDELNAKELAKARKDPDYVKKWEGTRRSTWPECEYALRVLKREAAALQAYEEGGEYEHATLRKKASDEHPYGVVCAVREGKVVERNRGQQPHYRCENNHLCDDAKDPETKEVIRYTGTLRPRGEAPITMEAAMEKQAASRPRAVIVRGSPYYVDGNPKAEAFYADLAELVRAAGYEPSFDAGEPYTLPDESAALWVGHSRGQDRLQYAPDGVKTLAIDQFEERAKERRAENAKLMEAAGYKSWAEWPIETRPAPADEHYQVTDALREAIQSLATQNKTATYQEGGEFTHDGERHDLDTALRNAQDSEPMVVEDLKWVLEHDKPASELGNPNSLGNLLASQIPFLPAGGRRAGAAEVMAARMKDEKDRDAGMLLKAPILSQALALGAGGLASSAYLSKREEPLDTASAGIVAALGLGPLLATNIAREAKVRKIQRAYEDAPRRRRLRETKEIEKILRERTGSSRLGAVHVVDMMRDRRRRNLPAAAEVNDWMVLSGGPPAWPITVPISQLVDDRLSRQYGKSASDSHWSDSSNNPVVPLFFLASALGLAGRYGAHRAMTNRMAEAHQTPIERRHWSPLTKHIAGDPNIVIASPHDSSAFSLSPGAPLQAAEYFAERAANDPDLGVRSDAARAALAERIRDAGLISIGRGPEGRPDKRMDTAPILAHEAGHQAIDRSPDLVKFLQQHVYRHAPITSALAPVGALGAGLVSGGLGKGLALGGLVGVLGNAGTLVPEFEATRRGLKGLKSYDGGSQTTPGMTKDLAAAYATYFAAHAAPSLIAGGVGGAISAARKRRAARDEEEQEKEAALPAAQWWQHLQAIKRRQDALGSTSADQLAIRLLGSHARPARRQFFNLPEVKTLGITNRTKPEEVVRRLTQFDP